ncbi:hypothetical protein SBA3_700010 [Candidatus Sulfopaludibacter sp. SbA3]|nr:hypothetical protein SBA3_700010 [Candidatus Sulfopaludibacter sp. SbA3]
MVEAEELACYMLLITGMLLIQHEAANAKNAVVARPAYIEFTLQHQALAMTSTGSVY